MAKHAHIQSHPGIAVGKKALALCGKQFKVKEGVGDELPRDKPLCRDCIDIGIDTMRESDDVIRKVRALLTQLLMRAEAAENMMSPDQNLLIDILLKERKEFEAEQQQKADDKAAKKKAKRTCTCTWTSPEMMEEDPECPVHSTWHAEPDEDDHPIVKDPPVIVGEESDAETEAHPAEED